MLISETLTIISFIFAFGYALWAGYKVRSSFVLLMFDVFALFLLIIVGSAYFNDLFYPPPLIQAYRELDSDIQSQKKYIVLPSTDTGIHKKLEKAGYVIELIDLEKVIYKLEVK